MPTGRSSGWRRPAVWLAAAALAAVVGTAGERPADAVNPPAGFTDTVVATDLNNPIWMEVAPDGRLFVAVGGSERRIDIFDDNGLVGVFATLPQVVNLETGLLGLAFDPSFTSNGVVFIAYLIDEPSLPQRFRLSRFDSDGSVLDPQSEQVLFEVDDISPTEPLHQGGDVEFGPDGKLYWALGDRVVLSEPQTFASLFGKVLRLEPDGTIPTDNPFYAQMTGDLRAIYAIGLRNPWRMVRQPGTGALFLSDVGPASWEEINRVQFGANYGWPTVSGPGSGNPQFVDPVHAYPHDPDGCAVVGADFYQPVTTQFPAEYHGDLFYADHCFGWIAHYDPVTGVDKRFSTSGQRLVDVRVHPLTGALYYLDREFNGDSQGFTGGIGRVDYVGGVAALQVTSEPQDVTVAQGEAAFFSVSANGQEPITYQWLRDGAPIPGATSHIYELSDPVAGDNGSAYSVAVTDASPATVTSATATLTVTAEHAPVPFITTPTVGTVYSGGQTVAFSGGATDQEDITIPASSLEWDLVFHHNIHTHVFQPDIIGVAGGTFGIPTVGETDSDVWYRIYLTATDSSGAVKTVFTDVLPITTDVTLATLPGGLELRLDGTTITAPYSFNGVAGVVRTLDAPTPQSAGPTTYDFAEWSTGGAASHNISTPSTATTFTATYLPGGVDQPPVPSVTFPVHQAVVNAPVAMSGTATDDVGVVAVDLIIRQPGTNLYWDGVDDEFQVGWHKVQTVLDSPGGTTTGWTYIFDPPTSVSARVTTRATDTAGQKTSIEQLTVVVVGGPAVPPTVALLTPAHQSTSGLPVAVTGAALDDSAVAKVFLVVKRVGSPEWWDGAAWVSGWTQFEIGYDVPSGTFAYDFDPGGAGSARIYARALDDIGLVGTSSTNLVAYGGSPVPPTVALLTPAHQSTSGLPVAVTGTASDDSAVAKVFLVVKRVGSPEWWDGAAWVSGWTQFEIGYEVPSGTFAYDFDAGGVGSARIYARVKDDGGLVAVSATHKVDYS